MLALWGLSYEQHPYSLSSTTASLSSHKGTQAFLTPQTDQWPDIRPPKPNLALHLQHSREWVVSEKDNRKRYHSIPETHYHIPLSYKDDQLSSFQNRRMFPQTPLTILLLTLTTTTSALPSERHHQDPARQARIDAFNAQRPLHTTALLAGAAAQPTPASNARHPRIRDLQTVTGENGLWVSLDDLRREGMEGEGDYYAARVREEDVLVREREGWGADGGEI